MAGNAASSRSSARSRVVQRTQQGLIRLGHSSRVQVVEMDGRELCGVMALCAGESLAVDMEVMLSGAEAVVLGRAVGMTGCALRVHVNSAAQPDRRLLAAVTADVRTGAVAVAHRRAALRVVRLGKGNIGGRSAIGVIRCFGSASQVAGVADTRYIGQSVMSGMGPGAVRRGCAARRLAVTGRAVQAGEGRRRMAC